MSHKLEMAGPALALALVFAVLALLPSASTEPVAKIEPTPEVQAPAAPAPDLLAPARAARARLSEALRGAGEASNQALGYGADDPHRLRYEPTRQELIIPDEAWFKPGQAELLPEGKRAIEDLFPRLYQALNDVDPAQRAWLGGVRLEAHADPRWGGQTRWTWTSWSKNGELSQKRLTAVIAHLGSSLSAKEGPWRPLLALLSASSRSWSVAYCGGQPMSADAFAQEEPCAQERSPQDDSDSRRLTVSIGLSEAALLGSP